MDTGFTAFLGWSQWGRMDTDSNGWFNYVIEFPNRMRYMLTIMRYYTDSSNVTTDCIVINSDSLTKAQCMKYNITNKTHQTGSNYSKLIIGW